jgi:hypothetical protein
MPTIENGAPAPATPSRTDKPLAPYVSLRVDRVENGFRVSTWHDDDHIERVAYTPAEAGAAVAEMLARHMPADALAYAPRVALIPSRQELLDRIALKAAGRKAAKATVKAARTIKTKPADTAATAAPAKARRGTTKG